MNLVSGLRQHNSYKNPAYRAQIFVLNNELPQVQAKLQSCLNSIKNLPNSSLRQSVLINQVVVPSQLIDEFIALSYENTEREKETLGILVGSLEAHQYEVHGLILPKQVGRGDSCECTDDEGLYNCLYNRSWTVLGWIHTHPKHDLFLSSVDLHTHSSYQWFFPEAFAIVFAPTHPQQLGIFRLTSQGLRSIRECKEKGFHPHGREIFTEARNVELVTDLSYEVIDLR
jgi:proteasome lid subunit RPN8/RPN11